MHEGTALEQQRETGRGKKPTVGTAADTKRDAGAADVGAALRNAFQSAVDEDVPSELLDLLRRLD